MAKIYLYKPNGSVAEVMLDTTQESRLSMAISSFTSIEAKLKTFFSYTLNIPIKENRLALDFYLTNQEGSRGNLKAVIEMKFFAFPGFLKITGTGDHFIKANFVGGLANWTQLLPEFTRDLEFGTTLFTQASIDSTNANIDPYDGTNPVWFSLKKYNDYLDPTGVGPLDWRPDMMLKRVIEAVEDYTNIPIVSNLFNTEWFRRIMEPYRGDGTVEYEAYKADVSTAFFTGDSYIFAPTDPNFTITYDPFVYSGMPDFPIPPSLETCNVEVNLTITVNLVYEYANVFLLDDDLNAFDVQPIFNGTNEVKLKGTFTQFTGIYIFIDRSVQLLLGSEFAFNFESTPFNNSANILNRSVFPAGDKILEKIQGLSEAMNLVWFFDGSKIICDPKWDVELTTGETVPGFYRNLALQHDWTKLTECTKDHNNTPDQSVKRLLTFALKHDEENLNTIGERQWAETVELSSSYPEGEVIRPNSYYAAVRNSDIGDDYASVTPHAKVPLWTYDGGGPFYDFQPVLLYKAGFNRGQYLREGSVGRDTHPLAVQVGVEQEYDPIFYSFPVNLGMADYKGVPGLVSVFHQKDIDILNNGHKAKTRLIIDASTLYPLEEFFRRLKLVSSGCDRGFYIIEKVDLIGDNIAQVDLINVPQ